MHPNQSSPFVISESPKNLRSLQYFEKELMSRASDGETVDGSELASYYGVQSSLSIFQYQTLIRSDGLNTALRTVLDEVEGCEAPVEN